MAQLKILTLKDAALWQAYLKRLPLNQQDVYFTPEYYELYENNGDGQACCVVFERGNSLGVYPFLLNEINALGYELNKRYFDVQGAYGYNGVVSSSNDATFIDSYYKAWEDYCTNRRIVAEFTRFHPLIENQKFSQKHMDEYFDRYTVYVDLTDDEDSIFSKIHPSTRSKIRKAYRNEGLEIKPFIFERDFAAIYKIYNENMRRVGACDYLYFNAAHFKRFLSLHNASSLVGYCEGKMVAFFSCVSSPEYFGNYLRGSIRDYNNTGVNQLLYWEMIRNAKRVGCRYLHLGGGSNSEEENSLLKYKMNFSKSRSKFFIGKKVHNPRVYSEITRQWKLKDEVHWQANCHRLLGYREIGV